MKKISILILLIFLFSNMIFSISYSQTEKFVSKNTNYNKIIEQWKKEKKKLIEEIYEQTNISSLMDLTTAAKQLDDITDKLKTLSLSYKSVKIQKISLDRKYQQVLQDARDLVIQLNKKSADLKNKLIKIQILSQDLDNIKKQIKLITDTIYISKQQVKRYVAILYKINNDYYNSLDGLDSLKLLVKSNNIAKTLSQEDLIKILSLKTQELLDKLEQSESIKRKFLKKLYLTKVQYIDSVKEYETEIKILENRKKMLVDLLTMLKTNKKEIDAIYEKLSKNRISLKRQQLEIANSMKNALNDKVIKAKPIDLSDILKYTIKTDGDKFFNWPSRDYHKITAYFKDEKYYKEFGFEHDGIDIYMPQLSNIYAPAAGYVYKVVSNSGDYYNYIVLVHNYGYVTIYGHIHDSLVKEGEIVKRGQIIAKSGGTPGTRGAGKFTTGPHLHFEVWKNGQLIDPLSVLDLSVYKDKNSIPFNWHIKYIKDQITRKIDLSNVKFYPLSLSERKRIELFLKSKAAPGFNYVTGWVQIAKKMKIDPVVAICIGYAESGLGWNLSSKNNVGNVGNNDRGNRIGYPTPQSGINAIYYALNNKYMSKYYTIYSLSRYGNKDAHIYSSSTFNWYKNVVKCLSTIKGYPVDEYYPFRQ